MIRNLLTLNTTFVIINFVCITASLETYSQQITAPFIARINLNGEQDRSYNNGAYSTFLNIKPDRVVRGFELLRGDPNIFYLCANFTNNVNEAGTPVAIKLFQNKPDPNYVPGFGFSEVDPKAEYFQTFQTYSAEYDKDKGIVLYGTGKVSGNSDFYPASYKINEQGFLDNLYREGGTFFLINSSFLNTRIKSSAVSSVKLAGSIESYKNGVTSQNVFCSSLNGNNFKVSADSIKNIEDPNVVIYKNEIYLTGTTRVPSKEYLRDGGITLAKFDINAAMVKSFGNQGKIEIPLTSSKFQTSSFTIVNDKIYMGGKMGPKGIAVVRLNIDGSLDETFAGDGISVKYLTGANIMFGDMLVNNTFIYITGSYGRSFFTYRLNLDGSFDNSYNIFEYSELNNSQGVSIASDKIEYLSPFKLIESGSTIMIAGNATIKK
ncbi:hypothetical protein FLA105534_04147 [Flavobacterium bizetiae]|uniref:Delta-60 repeat domain-containing protein n=2 Tax=Flavobacterium bizetiae TaxID=2704140 RepID=A0A6J4GTH9_9FLAO|nr:hypothetical protein FLA105534_04147 [Flavobacterium bizetiae]CAD5342387.1 hypothetical protein FLA105535_02373 [Flavobacterium bizetiae]CAD5350824.1 hypothetical protein FLA105534_04819 [Flavobacterium bizetiae]